MDQFPADFTLESVLSKIDKADGATAKRVKAELRQHVYDHIMEAAAKGRKTVKVGLDGLSDLTAHHTWCVMEELHNVFPKRVFYNRQHSDVEEFFDGVIPNIDLPLVSRIVIKFKTK